MGADQDRVDGGDLLLTHEFLATMLGVRRPGVTSATHALEGMGSIRNKRGRIEVRNREMLLELAGDAYQVAEDEYERVFVITESRDRPRSSLIGS